ncbi:MAG TPA: VWA domain-containing protein [Vicinamibacterales bacterium]
MNDLLANVFLFGRVLRRAGLDVHHGRMLDAAHALTLIDIGRKSDVRTALRSLLVHRHEDLARFDAAFDLFFRLRPATLSGLPLFSLGERPRVVARPSAGTPVRLEGDARSGSPSESSLVVGAYSAAEISRTKDFSEFTDAELARAQTMLASLPWHLGVRRTRRWEAARGSALDLRRLARRNLMRGGDLLELPRRRRREAPRPLVLLGDVSGSMERYSRVLLHFAYGLAHGARHVESFVFATRLTRVTRSLATPGADKGLSRLVARLQDWGGGTRIGEALRAFNMHWARRVMRNGPVVLIVSDGWDRGDPALLARELARVRRRCRRLVWLNPLLGSARYEPLTRGMQAALQHVDDFLPAHNLASLEDLARHLRALPSGHAP